MANLRNEDNLSAHPALAKKGKMSVLTGLKAVVNKYWSVNVHLVCSQHVDPLTSG